MTDNFAMTDTEEDPANYRYAAPTFSSILPKYERGELERIRNSFNRGSMHNIRTLPSKLAPGNVDDRRHVRISGNLNSKPARKYKAPVLPHSFSKLAYQYNDYDKEQEIHKCNIEEERVKVDCWSRKPFTTTSRAKLKHEEVFKDANYKFPESYGEYKGVPKLQDIIRSDLNDSSRYKHGKFNSYVKKEREVCKTDTRIWAKKIYEKLSADWPHLRFKVKFTENDELLVCFPIEDNSINVQFDASGGLSPENEVASGADSAPMDSDASAITVRSSTCANSHLKTDFNMICRYMRHMSAHGLASKIGLKKRGDRWRRLELEEQNNLGATGDIPSPVHIIVFSFYAPWVKVKIH